MFPIRDTLPTHHRPVLTYGLIAANLLVYLLLAPELDRAVWELGAESFHYTGMDPVLPPHIPALLSQQNIPLPQAVTLPELLLRTFSHMFLHGGLLHLLGNLWFLYIFADNVEDRLGRTRFVLLYLLSGLGALLAQVLATPASALPMVGASGAISGVLGAYLLFFPQARIVTLVPLGFFPLLFLISGRVFLVYWFALQLLFGLGSSAMAGGVAWWAHIGGFATGLLLAKPLAPPRRRIRVTVKRPPPPYRSQGMPFALLLALALCATAAAAQTPSETPPQTPPQTPAPIPVATRTPPRHRPDLRLPPPTTLEHLHRGNTAHVKAREQRRATPRAPRPSGAGTTLAVVHACADLSADLTALLAQAPSDLLVLSSPGPLVRSPEAALAERAATKHNTSLFVILTHEDCPSLKDRPADTPTETPAERVLRRKTEPARRLAERRRITPAHAHGRLQAETLYATSETLRHLRDQNHFAVAIGIVDEKTHAIRWVDVE